MSHPTSLELCAGAGGQALGLEWAGFKHIGALELDPWAHKTLLLNRPEWNPRQVDIHNVEGDRYKGISLLAGGVPCPPFSVAGRQLGADDERDLFPAALEWIAATRPRAVMLENVPGLAAQKFDSYRDALFGKIRALGFARVEGRILQAADFGVPQLRPRYIIVAIRESAAANRFVWPEGTGQRASVGEALLPLMKSRGWKGADLWSAAAAGVGPTLVGGSKLHGGPDLGPTRAKRAWLELRVNGMGVADSPPGPEDPEDHIPKLTVAMAARVQGFPSDWRFAGGKTAAYRQVGNAFPPPVAKAVGAGILKAILPKVAAASRTDLHSRGPALESV